MANRFVLNDTSYHGKGAINEILLRLKQEALRKFQYAVILTYHILMKKTDTEHSMTADR